MKLTDSSLPVLVAGAGLSGTGAARLLLSQGYRVILFDEKPSLDEAKIRCDCGCTDDRLTIVCGALPETVIRRIRYCVISPGIPLDKPFVQTLESAGVAVVSEIELACCFARGKLAAITGTNGKTTTTSLLGHILREAFPSVFVVGNIGCAFTGEAPKTTPGSVTVAELSSFQLETLHDFSPSVTAILNITPDHLNRHKTMERYADAKKNICAGQGPEGFCVLNREDPLLSDVPERTRAKVLWFSSRREQEEGAFLRGEQLVVRLKGRESVLCTADELHIVGRHNLENAMAAVLMAYCLDVPEEKIRQGLLSFRAVEHRIEYVLSSGGVTYYNDSKGTNPDAAVQAVLAMKGPILLIAGGYDKKADFTGWLLALRGRVKKLLLLGDTADQIEAGALRLQAAPVQRVASLEEAVREAVRQAGPGDCVLLSPACASWDMFTCYEERGRLFKEYVRKETCCRA